MRERERKGDEFMGPGERERWMDQKSESTHTYTHTYKTIHTQG